jgi:hypothetical protein
VVEKDQTLGAKLNLSSQAQTGLKIPPGQIMGGPIHVAAGQSVDLNIDFNGCRSIVAQGNGQYRLDPVLVAYQVSQNLTGISGQVVEGSFGTNGFGPSSNPVTPVANANVALEKPGSVSDGSISVDTISNWLTTADANGNFAFCPLPMGPNNTPTTFDVVANAGASGTTNGNFNASIVRGVQNGNKVTVPLLPETGGPATLTGSVSATSSGSGSFTAYLFAVQEAATDLEFAVPLLPTTSTPQVNVSCPSGACAPAAFTLVVPASNPVVGTFSSGAITWPAQAPAASPVNYKVEATCSTGSGPVGTFSTPATAVTAGTSTALPAGQPPSLTGCTAQ